MNAREIFKLPKLAQKPSADASGEDEAGQTGARAQTTQRLQVGLSGLAGMVLLVGLANIIQDRARVTEEHSVPEAAPTVAPQVAPQQSDPLADAGVVPDIPVEPTPTPTGSPAIVPEQGTGTSGRQN